MASARKFTGRRGRGKSKAAPKEAPANLLSVEVTRLEGDRLMEAWRNGRHPNAFVTAAMGKVYERLAEQLKNWPRTKTLKLITTRDGYCYVSHFCCHTWEQRYMARGGRLTADEREWLAPLNHIARVLAIFVSSIDRKSTPRMERDSLPEDILSGVESSFSEPQTETAE